MSAVAVNPAYTALLTKFSPRVIRTEEQNERYIAALYELEQQGEAASADELELAEMLTLLIEDFEEKRYGLKKATPLEMLGFLMEQHGLRQKDLVNVFGTPSIVSEVMRGRRELNKEQIRRLGERFGVSVELFF